MKKFFKVVWPPVAYFVLQNFFVLLLFALAVGIPAILNNTDILKVLSDTEEINKVLIEISMPGMLINALVCIFLFGLIYYRKEAQYINKKKVGLQGYTLTVLSALLCFYISSIIAALLQPFFRENEALNQSILAGGFLINIITVGIAVPIVEEIIFRGIVFSRLRRYLGSTPAILISALFFGLVHLNVIQSVYATLIGIFLGYLVEKYNTIKVSIVAHILVNSISIGLYYLIK